TWFALPVSVTGGSNILRTSNLFLANDDIDVGQPFMDDAQVPSTIPVDGRDHSTAGSSDADLRPSSAEPTGFVQFLDSLSRRAEVVVRPWLTWIVTGWVIGVLLCSLRPVLGVRMLSRLRKVNVSAVSEEIQSAVLKISRRLGLRRTVEILQS